MGSEVAVAVNIVLGPAAYQQCLPLMEDWTAEGRARLFRDMEAMMNRGYTAGVGLAAPQIGLPVRAFVIRPPASTIERPFQAEPCVLDAWNPVVEELDLPGLIHRDGCLSYPDRWEDREFHRQVTFRNGDGRRYVLYGYEAVVFQHEMKHIDGVNPFGPARSSPCPCGSGQKYKRCCGL